MNLRIGYWIAGSLLLFESIYLWMSSARSNLLFLLIFSVAIVNLALAYLQPQFQQKDERIRMIREKGLSYSYLVLIVALFTLFLLLHFQLIALTATSVILLLTSLMLITVSFMMVVFSLIL